MRVYVSGHGVVSALGFGAAENLDALMHDRHGMGKAKYLLTSHDDTMLGEVKATNEKLSEIAGLSYDPSRSRTILLAIIAAREAMSMAGLDSEICRNVGFVNGTSVGGMDVSERLYGDLLNKKKISYGESFYGHDCGHSTQFIVHGLGLKGYSSTISTACSSAANAIMHAGRLIRSGQVDRVIAGGSDALSLFTLNGFNSLKILDHDRCRPFDVSRKGLNLGEGSGFLVLESEASLKSRKASPLAELSGYGNTNDAYHQTASSPEGNGAYMAMKRALQLAGKTPEAIGYINAHGTGTDNNDRSEGAAIKRLFGGDIPAYSSTKAHTGHTLAAAGGIEAVFSIMSLSEGLIFPNLNLGEAMADFKEPARKLVKKPVSAVLSNSFGFAGNCTSLIFSAV